MTLVELLVVISLLGVVVPMLTAFMISIQNTLVKETNRTQSNDQVRLAVESLDREIRSGDVLYDPQAENDAAHYIFPGMSLRIYTQANATTRGPQSNGERCVQWRIKYRKYADVAGTQVLPLSEQSYQLQRREWAQSAGLPIPGTDTPWRVVADRVMNRVSPQTAAFAVDPAHRVVNIVLLANKNSTSGSTVRVDTTVEGRNTVYSFPDLCGRVPLYPQDSPES
jgi:type II secretory pathway pseudopilin PulG